MKSEARCHLKELLAAKKSAALAALHDEASVLAETLRTQAAPSHVEIVMDGRGATVRVSGHHLSKTVHGDLTVAPHGIVNPLVNGEYLADAVRAAVTAAAGRR